MNLKKWDALEEEMALMVLEGHLPFPQAIGRLALKYPECRVGYLVLASISFCSSMDENLGLRTFDDLLASHRRFEVLAALSGDIAILHKNDDTCASLVGHWIRTDDAIFLV